MRLLLAFVAWSCLASAQHRLPTDAEVEAVKQQHRLPTDAEISKAASDHSISVDAKNVQAQAGKKVSVDALHQAPKALDLAALSRNQEAFARQTQNQFLREPAFMVFVSLSMPKPTLAAIIDQAERSRAALVLRGLVNGNVMQTAAAIRELSGERQVGWLIDPEAFKRYSVSKVPTYVLVPVQPVAPGCGEPGKAQCAPSRHAAVSGDVPFSYALRQIAERAPELAADANHVLARLGP